MTGGENLFISGVKLLLTMIFLHRCILVYERWTLGRTEKVHTSKVFNGKEPFPSLTFKRFIFKNESYKRDIRSHVTIGHFSNGSSSIDLLKNLEDYFTEVFWDRGLMSVYYLTLNLPPSDLASDPKPQLGIQFKLDPLEFRFYIFAHPPHYMRYGRDVLPGVQSTALMLSDIEPGERILLQYSFALKKLIQREDCTKDHQPLDNCQIDFIERKLGCQLPSMRGGQPDSNFDKLCDRDQLMNASKYMYALWDAVDMNQLNQLTGCLPACNLYMPSLTRDLEIQHKENKTDRLLGMTLTTDQLSIPVEEVVLSYDNLDAMADVGGFLGLLLGASCLSMIKNISEKSRRMLKNWRLKY